MSKCLRKKLIDVKVILEHSRYMLGCLQTGPLTLCQYSITLVLELCIESTPTGEIDFFLGLFGCGPLVAFRLKWKDCRGCRYRYISDLRFPRRKDSSDTKHFSGPFLSRWCFLCILKFSDFEVHNPFYPNKTKEPSKSSSSLSLWIIAYGDLPGGSNWAPKALGDMEPNTAPGMDAMKHRVGLLSCIRTTANLDAPVVPLQKEVGHRVDPVSHLLLAPANKSGLPFFCGGGKKHTFSSQAPNAGSSINACFASHKLDHKFHPCSSCLSSQISSHWTCQIWQRWPYNHPDLTCLFLLVSMETLCNFCHLFFLQPVRCLTRGRIQFCQALRWMSIFNMTWN